MTWAEKLIKEFNKQKHREEVNSGQHNAKKPNHYVEISFYCFIVVILLR